MTRFVVAPNETGPQVTLPNLALTRGVTSIFLQQHVNTADHSSSSGPFFQVFFGHHVTLWCNIWCLLVQPTCHHFASACVQVCSIFFFWLLVRFSQQLYYKLRPASVCSQPLIRAWLMKTCSPCIGLCVSVQNVDVLSNNAFKLQLNIFTFTALPIIHGLKWAWLHPM